MAEIAAMDIVIGAKVDGATAGLNKVQSELAQTAVAAGKTDSALGKLSRGTTSGTNALMNFGRVVQDAPFGLIGIANNIDPLISSFQSLKAASGGTGAALKAMVGSLAGPAGIGLAVSAVTSLLIVFGDKLFSTESKVDTLDTQMQDLGDSVKAIGTALDNASDSLSHFKDIAALDIELRIGEGAQSSLEVLRVALQVAERNRNLSLAAADEAFRKMQAIQQKAADAADPEQAKAFQGLAEQALEAYNKADRAYQKSLGDIEILTKQIELAQRAVVKEQAETLKNQDEILKKKQKEFEKNLELLRQEKLFANLRLGGQAPPPDIEGPRPPDQPLIGIGDAANAVIVANRKKKEAQDAADAIEKANELLKEQFELGQQIQGVFSNIFSDIADKGKISFESLMRSVEQLIIKLAAAAAAAFILKSLFSPVNAAGTALNFGAIFKGILGIPFAEGGIVTGPTRALIGEAGPEVVLPLDRLREFMTGGSSQVVVLETRVRGDDLYLINSRTAARRGRAY